MTRISKPRRVIKEGDRVRYTHPANDALSLVGVVEGDYGENRLLVTTSSGHTWALRICDLTLYEES